MKVYRGTIVRMSGSWESGLAMIEIDDARRGKVVMPCHNAATVLNFEDAFGPGVILEGHRFDPDAIAGKEIYYSTNELGIFRAFSKVEDVVQKLVDMYNRDEEEEGGELS